MQIIGRFPVILSFQPITVTNGTANIGMVTDLWPHLKEMPTQTPKLMLPYGKTYGWNNALQHFIIQWQEEDAEKEANENPDVK